MSGKASAWLHVATLQRLLVVVALVLAPHAARLPVWETVAVALVLVWRAWAARRHQPMPGKWLRAALALAAFASVWASYGHINGQHAGVALIVVMAALKLTELEQRRDVMVMVFLLYFIGVTHFLFTQELWTIAYLLLVTTAITALLVESNHAGQPLALKVTLRRGGLMVAQALPLMLAMFVLFPRVPGPLWGLPSDAGASRSGLSDKMSPGDIASLIQSDEIAFRVRFDGPVPANRFLYWRGPVFWAFDGREWSEGGPPPRATYPVQDTGEPVGYEVALEPNRTPWLMALDAVDAGAIPADSELSADGRLLSNTLVRERRLYHTASFLRYVAQPQLPEYYRRLALRLPKGRNPRSVALAQQWRTEAEAQGLGDAAIVSRALALFREQAFVYTLNPPMLGVDPVDSFLFDTRRGFCEHYSSSFTVLMRAAGIPARIVTGYQGAAAADYGPDWIVRQSDAHAWSEVWLPDRGWLRIDPTAAVAPNRIERNLASALPPTESAGLALRRSRTAIFGQLEARWDWLNSQWNRWVLGYGPELQQWLLGHFGLEGWRDLMLAMIIVMSLIGGVFGALALRHARPARHDDAALKAWKRATARLARRGYRQAAHEGPQDFVARVARAEPRWAAALQQLLDAYLATRYGHGPAMTVADLEAAARSLRVGQRGKP
jgi:protein-glutamine gamma-glutamyltransferase